MKKDKAKYFGPYTSVGAVRDTIELIRKLYKIRSCNRRLPRDIGLERPCLNYHIHQCYAPCQGYISREEYRKSIDEVVRFLNGNYDPILKELEENAPKDTPDPVANILLRVQGVYDILVSDSFTAAQKNEALKQIVDKIVYDREQDSLKIYYFLYQ